LPIDILVVNNGPDRDVGPFLKNKFSDVIYHYAGRETGFAAGNNIGLRYGFDHDYDYTLLLNNDTIAEQDFLSPLIAVMEEDETVAMVGPAIYYYQDRKRLWSCGGKINWWNGGLGGETSVSKESAGLANTDYLPGTCILARIEALRKIGLMSEAYFLGVEEADWAIKARRAGFRVVACPGAVLLHKVGVSSQFTPELIYNGVRNRFLFIRRHFPPLVSWLLIWPVLANELRRHSQHRSLCWRALKDHFKYSDIRRSHLDAVRLSNET
jgi:hypothetical protein